MWNTVSGAKQTKKQQNHFSVSGKYEDHTQLSQEQPKRTHRVLGQYLTKAHTEIHETSLDTKQ